MAFLVQRSTQTSKKTNLTVPNNSVEFILHNVIEVLHYYVIIYFNFYL